MLHHAAVHVEIAGDEHALPRHLDLVEDHERVLLVETRREGVIGAGSVDGVVVAAHGVQAFDAHGYREAQRV